jgi:ABC-type branched-subunit amino acid transport system ATPase component
VIERPQHADQKEALLAAQNVGTALRLSGRCCVIDDGHIRFKGGIAELNANDEVRKKYLLV